MANDSFDIKAMLLVPLLQGIWRITLIIFPAPLGKADVTWLGIQQAADLHEMRKGKLDME